MGMGGHLMWTAVAKNIKKHLNKNCTAIENNNFCNSKIFANNPNFSKDSKFILNLSEKKTNYVKRDGGRVVFSTKDHAIKHALKYYGINDDIDLKCEIYPTKEEENKSESIVNDLPLEYVCIEPHSKTSWMKSRVYPFDKYQNIVNALKDKFNFVQIGSPNSRKLDNALCINGKLTFRETYGVLKNSMFLLSTEGGLVHLANASGTKSFVIYTSYQHPSMTMYPENTLIDIALYRDEILGYKNHELYEKERESHNETEIIELINEEK